MEVTISQLITLTIAMFMLGVGVGIIILDEIISKQERGFKKWERLLNEREQLLDQRDTERYKVFKETFKNN